MLPTHTSASELLNAVCSRKQSDDVNLALPLPDDVCDSNDVSGPSTVTTAPLAPKDSFPMRRPMALALEPIDTRTATTIGTISAGISTTTTDAISSNVRTRDQNQKHINIAFNNITYTVHAGLMRRGESSMFSSFFFLIYLLLRVRRDVSPVGV